MHFLNFLMDPGPQFENSMAADEQQNATCAEHKPMK